MMAAGPKERTLIGLDVCIVDATHEGDIGLSGTVVDETRDTVVIDEAARRRVLKKDVLLEIDLEGKTITINGADLAGLPEERIKRIR